MVDVIKMQNTPVSLARFFMVGAFCIFCLPYRKAKMVLASGTTEAVRFPLSPNLQFLNG